MARYEITEKTILNGNMEFVKGFEITMDGHAVGSAETREAAEAKVAKMDTGREYAPRNDRPRRTRRYAGAAAPARGGDIPEDPRAARRFWANRAASFAR